MHPFKIIHYFVLLENCCPVYGVLLSDSTTDVTQLLSEIFFHSLSVDTYTFHSIRFFFYLSFSCILVLVSLFSWLWDKKENTSSHNKPKKCLRLWEGREKMRDKEKETGEGRVLNTRERFHVVSHKEFRSLSPTTITNIFFLFSE